ncbi:MAG: formylmethanofuran dehydrogenase subunit B [Candidatus Methanospirareceae archaeon]
MRKVIEAVVCPFCACLCDDIVVTVENERIKEVRNACKFGVSKFLSIYNEKRPRKPMVDGEEVEYAEAIEEAAEILRRADKPLIYGLSNSGYNAQRVALEIARKKRGVFDNTDSICHNLFYLELQRMKHPFFYATMDEIRDKADVVVFWGCNPIESHLRLLSKFSVYPMGEYVQRGVMDREVIVIDAMETKLKKIAKSFLRVKPGEDFKIADIMKMLVVGETEGLKELIEEGMDINTIGKIADRMRKAFYGVIFLGLGIFSSANASKSIESIFSLVEELNNKGARFVIFPVKGHFNVVGATQLLLRETGYPFGVDFSSHIIFQPGKTTVLDVIEEGEVDAALIVGADPFASFPMEKVRKLRDMPMILIDPFESITSRFATVVLPSAVTGIEAEEIAYRMDGLPCKLEKIIESEYMSDEEILREIYERL